MGKRRFRVEFSGDATIELDDAVIDAVDDAWRSFLYNLHTPEEIAEHIGYNLVINRLPLHKMDGWADEPFRGLARVIEEPDWELYAYDPEIVEKRMK